VKFVEKCAECERISAAYETATIEWFRLQNQLTIAEHARDDAASDSIVAELTVIASQRERLRDSADQHFTEAHPVKAAPCGRGSF
jgi:hypothetical protein